MNNDDRRVYKPAPVAGAMKCPKCGGDMKPSPSNPKVSVCPAGHSVSRLKIG